MPASDWAAEAARSGVPITYVWGSDDAFVPVEQGRRLAATIGADLVEIADAGHLVWLDQPDTTARAVLEALDRGRPRRDGRSGGPARDPLPLGDAPLADMLPGFAAHDDGGP